MNRGHKMSGVKDIRDKKSPPPPHVFYSVKMKPKEIYLIYISFLFKKFILNLKII